MRRFVTSQANRSWMTKGQIGNIPFRDRHVRGQGMAVHGAGCVHLLRQVECHVGHVAFNKLDVACEVVPADGAPRVDLLR